MKFLPQLLLTLTLSLSLICFSIAAPRSESLQEIDAARAGGRVALSQPLTKLWRYDSTATLNLTPAVDSDRLYLPLAAGILVSLSASNGQLNWRSELGGELSASPVANEQDVYAATEVKPASTSKATGTLRALGREGGVTQWMKVLPAPLQGSLALANGRVLAGGSDGNFYSIDASSGKTRWIFAYSAAFDCHPVISEGRIYVGSEDGSLLAINESNGRLAWRYKTRGPIRGPVALANGSVYFGSGDNYVYALNAANGKLLWKKRTGAGVQAVARVEDALLVASLDNFVYRFSLSGKRVWKRQLSGRIAAQMLTAADGALFTPLSSPAGVVLSLHDGRPLNSLPLDEEITSSAAPVAIGDTVFLTTERGLVAFAQPKDLSRPKD